MTPQSPPSIVAVSYLNTIPFIYGIEHVPELRGALKLLPPSGCAERFIEGLADITLLPSGVLTMANNPRIITNYCIGASRSVRTVVIISNEPIEQVQRIFLDSQSRTSVLLGQVLCAHHWKISPTFTPFDLATDSITPQKGDAYLIIGDKVFGQEGRWAYTYDLADAWREMTGLPFVFAVWVARDEVSQQTITMLNDALKFGTEHIWDSIKLYGHASKTYAERYLKENIDFCLDSQKLEALELFQQLHCDLKL